MFREESNAIVPPATVEDRVRDLVDSVRGRFSLPERVEQAQRYLETRRGDGVAVVCGAEEVLERSYGEDAASHYRYEVVAPDGCHYGERRLSRAEERAFLDPMEIEADALGPTHFALVDARQQGALWRFSWEDPELLDRATAARG